MKKRLLFGFLAIGVAAFAAGNTVKVNLTQDSVIDGKTFKAGEYKISIENGSAVLKQGKQSFDVPAREETEANKIASTELYYKNGTDLQEIRVGGTHTKIVFEGTAPANSGL